MGPRAGARFCWLLTVEGLAMIGSLMVGIVFFVFATFPAAWVLMLFLGNVGVGRSDGGTLRLGVVGWCECSQCDGSGAVARRHACHEGSTRR